MTKKPQKPQAVFVSYSREDAQIVTPITRLMEVVGAQAFKDTDKIKPGQLWRKVIFTAIEKATLIMVFWSKTAAASKNVREEWQYGLKKRKTIVPVLLDSTPLDRLLAPYQWLDLRDISAPAAPTRRDSYAMPGRNLRPAPQPDEVAGVPVAAIAMRLLNHIQGLQ